MRAVRVFGAVAGIGLLMPAVLAGCFNNAEDCERLGIICTTTATTTSSSTGGGGGGPDPTCIPSQVTGPISNTCGIFVSALGNDANMGTQGSPVATLKRAIELADPVGKSIYACAETFAEAIELPAGIELYGGLDCSKGWSWSETGRTTLTGGPDQIPVKMLGGPGTTRLENFVITAADATAMGGSSIAVIAQDVAAAITRAEITAGSARDGADGQTPTEPPMAGDTGAAGSDACTPAASIMGGAGAMAMCDGVVTQGGNGGNGGNTAVDPNGQTGTNGVPDDPTKGKGGDGDTGTGCSAGTQGANGTEGMPGPGGTALGTISIVGYAGSNGQEGGTGTPGQGGGGGGGVKSGVFCGMPKVDGSGASGGGGGAGGCGGKGGTGGQAGGSSIALISLNATLTLTLTSLTVGPAGNGGAGAGGQEGGAFGSGGAGGKSSGAAPSIQACTGGDGGLGGFGGPGGGGRGGHSIGLAFNGAQPPIDGLPIVLGAPGIGGVGATGGGEPAGNGADGLAMNAVELP